MADVIQKIISANNIHHGSRVVHNGAGKPTYFDINPSGSVVAPSGGLEVRDDPAYTESKLTFRLDDPTFYTA